MLAGRDLLNLCDRAVYDSCFTVMPMLLPLCAFQVGPVSMQFEIPMYNVSNLQVRYLKIAELAKSYNPFR